MENFTIEHTVNPSDKIKNYVHTFDNGYVLYIYFKDDLSKIESIRINSPGKYSSGHSAGKAGDTPANIIVDLDNIFINKSDNINITIKHIRSEGKCLNFDYITINDYLITTNNRPDGYCVYRNIIGQPNSVTVINRAPPPAAAGAGGGSVPSAAARAAAVPKFEPIYLKGYKIQCPVCGATQDSAHYPFKHNPGCTIGDHQPGPTDWAKMAEAQKGGRRRTRRSRKRLSRRRRNTRR